MKKKNIKVYASILCICVILGVLIFVLNMLEKKSDEKDREKIEATMENTTSSSSKNGTTNYLEFKDDLYKYTDDCEAYVIMGTDGSGNESAEGEEYRGTMADFLLVVIMNKTINKYGFIQINRDTICDVTEIDSSGEGEGMEELQICTAHWYGKDNEQSCENTVTSVSYLLGEMDIDGYYEIGMEDIGRINHLVGGVKVKIEDDLTGADPQFVKGTEITLNDEQAEKYVRARMDVGDENNLKRMERQRTYMSEYFDKAKEIGKENPAFINDSYKELMECATTDINGNKVSVIANTIAKMEYVGVFTFDGESRKGKKLDDGKEHAEFIVDGNSIVSVLGNLINIEKD